MASPTRYRRSPAQTRRIQRIDLPRSSSLLLLIVYRVGYSTPTPQRASLQQLPSEAVAGAVAAVHPQASLLMGATRATPSVHDGGSLAGNESSSVSSTDRVAARRSRFAWFCTHTKEARFGPAREVSEPAVFAQNRLPCDARSVAFCKGVSKCNVDERNVPRISLESLSPPTVSGLH